MLRIQKRFEALREAYPGRRLLIVSNTAGANSWDTNGELASNLQKATGVSVLSHRAKKPGCGEEIMSYFREHPEIGVTSPYQIAVVGDRLSTDIMLANMMGSWGVWVKDGVVPLREKNIVSARCCSQTHGCLLTCLRESFHGWRGDLHRTFWRADIEPLTHPIPLNEQVYHQRVVWANLQPPNRRGNVTPMSDPTSMPLGCWKISHAFHVSSRDELWALQCGSKQLTLR